MSELIDRVLRVRRPISIVVHAAIIVIAHYVAFWLRFDGDTPPEYARVLWSTLPWVVAVRLAVFVPFRLFEGLWRYSSLWDLRTIIAGATTSSIIIWLIDEAFSFGQPRSIHILSTLLVVILTGGIRVSRRLYDEFGDSGDGRRVLIYGAGDAGESILRDLRRQQVSVRPVGFVDDDPRKRGRRIHGVPVLGARADVPRILERHRPDEVLIAVPSASQQTIRAIVRAFENSKVRITTLPSLRQLMGGKVNAEQIRALQLEDLLARAPIALDVEPVRQLVAGRRILVTGAGGSIGSEICRQVAALNPASLVAVDRYENGLFDLLTGLTRAGHHRHVHGLIGDVTDSTRMRDIFTTHRPEIVFHAAAHKHVPLMEANPCEAVKNNVGGSHVIAEIAQEYGADRFVMISTDKAVNPTSVMGATKRVAELITKHVAGKGETNFTTVRFGNVLGSNGSVIPLFIEQIRRGGPVTVTDPSIKRFFMLIPEAVQLVLHAATLGGHANTYVLEMGEQVKLLDVARDLIRLSGHIPEEEIPIIFTGLRPGEKLFEELVGLDECDTPSSIEKIRQIRQTSAHQLHARLPEVVGKLEAAAAAGDRGLVLDYLRLLVPTFESEQQVLTA